MSEIARVTVNWTGFVGAPGYTNLHFRQFEGGAITQAIVDDAITRTDAWLGAWLPYLPAVVNVAINPTVEIIEDTTATLVRFESGAPLAGRIGSGSGVYSAPTGACVNWNTNGIRNGRRVRGRTFMVPLVSNAFATDGTLAVGMLNATRAANAGLITDQGSAFFAVFARPTTPGGVDGVSHNVMTTVLPDMASVLRSRRD